MVRQLCMNQDLIHLLKYEKVLLDSKSVELSSKQMSCFVFEFESINVPESFVGNFNLCTLFIYLF